MTVLLHEWVTTHTTFELPLTLKVDQNSREHHMVKARKTKAERSAIALCFPRSLKGVAEEGQWRVIMLRISPRELDSDNLVGRFKGVRDEIAKQMGINDRDKRISFECAWMKAQTGVPQTVRILVERVG